MKYLGKKANMKSLLNVICNLNLTVPLFSRAFAFIYDVRMRIWFRRRLSSFTFAFHCTVKIILETFVPRADLQNQLFWSSVVQVVNWLGLGAEEDMSNSGSAESYFLLHGFFNISWWDWLNSCCSFSLGGDLHLNLSPFFWLLVFTESMASWYLSCSVEFYCN